MKKVLFVINTLGKAGAETALMELFRRLDPKEYEVSLYVLMGQGEMVKELPEHVKLVNTHYIDCPVLSKEGRPHMRKTVLRAMVSKGTLIRRIPYLVKNLWGMLRQGKILPEKLLWRILSDGAERITEQFDLAVAYLEGGSTYYVADYVNASQKAAFVHVDYQRAGYTPMLDGGCYQKYNRIFAVSDEVKKAFLKVYPECEDKTDVFHNMLNCQGIRDKAKQTGGFTDSFDGKRILSVGRLTEQKAFEISIEAMKLLKEKGENVRWYILGDGDQRKKLEELVRKLGLEQDFLMPGAVSNPYPYMDQSDIYVHASRFEGKSIAIQEAQILGKPILVSDCSGNREQVIPDVDGLMCQLSPEGICNGVLELLHDEEKRERLGMNASQKNDEEETQLEKLISMM